VGEKMFYKIADRREFRAPDLTNVFPINKGGPKEKEFFSKSISIGVKKRRR